MTTPVKERRMTLSQRRAAHAWSVVEVIHTERDKNGSGKYISPNVKGEPAATEAGKKLGGLMKQLPTRIIAAGLGQALAYLHAKDDAPLLEKALADWLLNARRQTAAATFDPNAAPDGKALLGQLVNHWAVSDLRAHTAEAVEYLPWLIRFAEAEGLMDRIEGGE